MWSYLVCSLRFVQHRFCQNSVKEGICVLGSVFVLRSRQILGNYRESLIATKKLNVTFFFDVRNPGTFEWEFGRVGENWVEDFECVLYECGRDLHLKVAALDQIFPEIVAKFRTKKMRKCPRKVRIFLLGCLLSQFLHHFFFNFRGIISGRSFFRQLFNNPI